MTAGANFDYHGATTARRQVWRGRQLLSVPQFASLAGRNHDALGRVLDVLPFKVNSFVIDELIQWSSTDSDPLFRLVFPHEEMLSDEQHRSLKAAAAISREAYKSEVLSVREQLNSDPSSQAQNLPTVDDHTMEGIQHKYTHTVLLFPSHGQTCHAYCGYCFRWPQFVPTAHRKHRAYTISDALDYVASNDQVTDVLVTGGDPLVMSTDRLSALVEALLDKRMAHVRNIRLGTKALSYWPYRVTHGSEGSGILRLFDRVQSGGKSLNLMLHMTCAQEVLHPEVRAAVDLVRNTGAVLRSQAPIVRGVNDTSGEWAQLWTEQTAVGIVPYYFFVERDTGAHRFYSVPIFKALDVYTTAIQGVSGLARTARGPVMSTSEGKVIVDGIVSVGGERAYSCRFLQARDPSMVGHIFFRRFNANATWFDELEPVETA